MFRINANVRREFDGQRFKFWDAFSIHSHEDRYGHTCIHVKLKNGKEHTLLGEIVSITSNLVAPYC